MSKSRLQPEIGVSKDSRFFPLLLLLVVGSGCSALIYEIVWFQLLQLVIGSSAVSLGVLLGTFMAGMCIGSLAFSRAISATRHPLRVYAMLELGIGIIATVALFVMPYAGGLYTAIGGSGLSGIVFRGVICGLCLLPPTILMGATLPAIARWSGTTPKGISWLGFFYGSNIAGGVFGCLLAGFYLLRIYDVATATYLSVAINLVVALLALLIARWTRYGPGAGIRSTPIHSNSRGGRLVYAAIALSGLCALGAEVVWTRVLSLMLGASVYTFSIILAVFLAGLGIGGGIGSAIARWSSRPRVWLGVCQMLLAVAIGWAAYMLSSVLPYWPIDPALASSPLFNFQVDIVRCMLAVLPATCLWGASVPLAIAAVTLPGDDPGRLVGGVYAANTAGAIVGALGFSLVFITSFGTQHAQQLLIGVAGLSGLLLLAPAGRGVSRNTTTAGLIPGIAAVVLAIVTMFSVAPVPRALLAYGRFMARVLALRDAKTKEAFVPNVVYVGEGINASVAVSLLPNGVRNFHVSGKVEASTLPKDMRLQRMLGHMSALAHPLPRSVLIVGFGSGVTAGTFVLHPGVERIVICEIEPLIPQIVSRYFSRENYNVLQDPRVEVVYDDARHYILTTDEKFDVITSDPINPWVKGAAALYTQEYFELVRKRLNPGGVISEWVPLYESSTNVVKSELATFFSVFPNGTIWSNDVNGAGYDIVLLAKEGGLQIDLDRLNERLNRPDHAAVKQSLETVGFQSAVGLLSTYAGRGVDLTSWLDDVELNRDRNLRLQYTAGLALNLDQNSLIFEDMLSYRRFPEDLFVGSHVLRQSLHAAISQAVAR